LGYAKPQLFYLKEFHFQALIEASRFHVGAMPFLFSQGRVGVLKGRRRAGLPSAFGEL
jgi:hypothetical protein